MAAPLKVGARVRVVAAWSMLRGETGRVVASFDEDGGSSVSVILDNSDSAQSLLFGREALEEA